MFNSKRFINNFRLQVHLSDEAEIALKPDLLARFLVLSEKIPGVVAHFYRDPNMLDIGIRTKFGVEFWSGHDELRNILGQKEKSEETIQRLFLKPPVINGKKLVELCDNFNFQYYRFEKEMKK